MNRSIRLWLFVLILSATLCHAERAGKNLVNGVIEVKRGDFKEIHFLIPESGKEIFGSFQTSGGMNDDITFLVLNQENYVKWLSGYPRKAAYKVERKKEGKFVIPVKPGDTYYFVMDNFFSTVSNKRVKLRLDLVIDRK